MVLLRKGKGMVVVAHDEVTEYCAVGGRLCQNADLSMAKSIQNHNLRILNNSNPGLRNTMIAYHAFWRPCHLSSGGLKSASVTRGVRPASYSSAAGTATIRRSCVLEPYQDCRRGPFIERMDSMARPTQYHRFS